MTASRGEGRRLLTNAALVIGSLGMAAIAVAALFGPQLAPSDPQAQRVIIFYPDHSFAAPPTPPDRYYLLGTDPLGRDQLSRLLWGARLTLTVLLLGLLGRGALGILLGVVAGWRHGGWPDRAVAYVTNAVGGVPQLLLALLIVIALRDAGIVGFVLALALVGWAELAQFVRAEVVRAVASPHVEAARAIGGTAVHIARAHVLRDIGPQLVGLLALEGGSVLLLLAELGFIGFFISGGTFYVDDSNRPILPIRDRAPEWGQMLAGARQYAFRDQYVAFIPGVVVVGAVLAFNLFAEGLRTAIDPFGTHRLLPRTLGRIGRIAAAAALIGAVGLGYVSVRSTSVSFDDGVAPAREAAERVRPGSELIAGVLRFASASHALARPEKLNYYFRAPGGDLLRVGFVDADANAMEVKLFDHEDDVVFEAFGPLASWPGGWERALGAAESTDGLAFRNANPQYTVRLIVAQDDDAASPLFRVQYGKPTGQPSLEVHVDAATGSADLAPERYVADAASRARQLLGGSVVPFTMGATWISERGPVAIAGDVPRLGTARPSTVSASFIRADGSSPRSASILYRADRPGSATSSVFAGAFGGGARATEGLPRTAYPDLLDAFQRVDAAELRALRERAEAAGRGWSVNASASGRDGARVDLTFTDGTLFASFRFDRASGNIERIR